MQLFLWCERHGLLDCAGDELNTVETLDREHPMIPVLRRRLKIELQQKNECRRPSENAPPPPSDALLDQMTRGMPPGNGRKIRAGRSADPVESLSGSQRLCDFPGRNACN